MFLSCVSFHVTRQNWNSHFKWYGHIIFWQTQPWCLAGCCFHTPEQSHWLHTYMLVTTNNTVVKEILQWQYSTWVNIDRKCILWLILLFSRVQQQQQQQQLPLKCSHGSVGENSYERDFKLASTVFTTVSQGWSFLLVVFKREEGAFKYLVGTCRTRTLSGLNIKPWNSTNICIMMQQGCIKA